MSDLADPIFEKSVNNFYYDEQFKKYLVQFMAIFSGLQVQIGKNDLGSKSDKIVVPIKHGSTDRVVAAIQAANTQNKPLRLPLLSAKIVDISINPNRYKGSGTIHRKTTLPLGESLPDGLQVVRRRMPVPFDIIFELAIYASNIDQQWQIAEQILILFDPSIQFQTSDKDFDWTKIAMLELETLNLDENYPANTDRRMLISTMTFSTTVQLSAPANYKQDFIKSVLLRLATIEAPDNVYDVVKDVNRPTPAYEKLFDIDDYDIPKT